MDEKSFKTKNASSSLDVIDFYDEYAETWDSRFGNNESTREFHKIRLGTFLDVAKLNQNKIAIELGVGTGPYVEEIAPKVKKLICIDGSKGMLDVLRKKTRNMSNVELQQIDLSNPLEKENFNADLVYFFGLIEHIINIDTLIENCKKMLQVSGEVVVVTPNALSPWYHGLRIFSRAGVHCTTDKYYSRRSLKKIMESHGFVEEECKYWGFFPAGSKGLVYRFLRIAGLIVSKTPLIKFAGGMTISYRTG